MTYRQETFLYWVFLIFAAFLSVGSIASAFYERYHAYTLQASCKEVVGLCMPFPMYISSPTVNDPAIDVHIQGSEKGPWIVRTTGYLDDSMYVDIAEYARGKDGIYKRKALVERVDKLR